MTGRMLFLSKWLISMVLATYYHQKTVVLFLYCGLNLFITTNMQDTSYSNKDFKKWCVFLCGCVHVSISAHRGQKKVLDHLELDIQVLRSKHRSSGNAVCFESLKHPSLLVKILCKYFTPQILYLASTHKSGFY